MYCIGRAHRARWSDAKCHMVEFRLYFFVILLEYLGKTWIYILSLYGHWTQIHSGAEITKAGQVQMASHGSRKLDMMMMMKKKKMMMMMMMMMMMVKHVYSQMISCNNNAMISLWINWYLSAFSPSLCANSILPYLLLICIYSINVTRSVHFIIGTLYTTCNILLFRNEDVLHDKNVTWWWICWSLAGDDVTSINMLSDSYCRGRRQSDSEGNVCVVSEVIRQHALQVCSLFVAEIKTYFNSDYRHLTASAWQ